jgi:aminoglycoside 2'-N-acetyltransferase I
MPSRTPSPSTVQIAHTSALPPGTLVAAHTLLQGAFGADLDEHDWEHARGGIHALVWDWEGRLIAHGSVVQRRIIHRGRALRAGYVEAVAVRAEHRRRGYGGAVMGALEGVIAGAYELGALSASELGASLYLARGWRQWQGPTFALTPAGVVRTAEEDGDVYVLEASAALDLDGELTCDWRDGSLW